VQQIGTLRRLPGTLEEAWMMEDRAGSTTVWAVLFLALALVMTVAGLAAIALGATIS
jgi:hypothetical protein